jgi:hypothetical protein
MDANPGPSSRPAAEDAKDAGAERYGPLALRRLRKDDGRALIAYARAETGGVSAGAGGPPGET